MKQVIIPQKTTEKGKKQKKLLESKSFYMVIAICLILVGIYGYTATQQNQVSKNMASVDYEPKEILPEQFPASIGEEVLSESITSEQGVVDATSTSEAVEIKFSLPVDSSISIPFSKDNLIFSKTMEDWRTHPGIDFQGSIGTPVKAAANGVVEQVKTDEMQGSVVIIRHNDQYKTKYCNLQSEVLVKEGEAVDPGTVIGGIGNTASFEIADGPHLHFEILYNGEPVNPEEHLPASD